MKKILLLFLLASSTLIAMEDKQAMSEKEKSISEIALEERSIESLGIPHELWIQILALVYFDPNILDELLDIYEGREAIEQYIPKCYKTLALVCKTFKNSNISQHKWYQIKEEIKKFYIPHLNQRFLEPKEEGSELYPIAGKWIVDHGLNKKIAQFISDKFMLNDKLLDNLIGLYCGFPYRDYAPELKIKIIKLLLFYGLNLNSLDCMRPLYNSILCISNGYKPIVKLLLRYDANPNSFPFLTLALEHYDHCIEIISTLLQYGARINMVDEVGRTALFYAVDRYHQPGLKDYTEAIKLLLRNSANPYVKNKKGITALDIARENNFKEFEQLVRVHSQDTLQKICLQHVLANLSKFEDKLDSLPQELQQSINKLKS